LYKGDGLKLIIYVCYSWEMALNTGLNLSFDNRTGKEYRRNEGKLTVQTLI
jgi:hypothetical protein